MLGGGGRAVPAHFHAVVSKDVPNAKPFGLALKDALCRKDLDKLACTAVQTGGVRNAVTRNMVGNGVHLKKETSCGWHLVSSKSGVSFFHRRAVRRDLLR